MINSLSTYRRRAGFALLAGASLNAAACIVSVTASAGRHVPSDLARAPMTHNAAIVVYVMAAIAEALLELGLVWLRRPAPSTARAVTVGLSAAIAGTVIIAVCNGASIAIEDQLNTTNAAGWVWSGFAGSSLLVVVGMIAAGLSISSRLTDGTWRDHAPLICGLLSLLLIVFQAANIVWLAIVMYSVGYAVLGAAQLTAPAKRRHTVAQPACPGGRSRRRRRRGAATRRSNWRTPARGGQAGSAGSPAGCT